MDVSEIFNFFLLGGGEGGLRGDRAGGSVFSFPEIPKRGGRVLLGGGGKGPEGCLRGICFFFSGPKFPPSKSSTDLEAIRLRFCRALCDFKSRDVIAI